jgi:pilus assembly protein CpaF
MIHDRLLNLLDLSLLDKLKREELNLQIRKVVEKILSEESFSLPLNLTEREKFFTEIIDEVL